MAMNPGYAACNAWRRQTAAEYRTYRAYTKRGLAIGMFEVRTSEDPRQRARDYWGARVARIEPVAGRTS